MIQSMFSTYKQQHFKVVNTLAKLNTHEKSSIKAPTPNIYFKKPSPTSIVATTIDALAVVGFSCSKQTIKRRITILASIS
jgi:hypothetical protein